MSDEHWSAVYYENQGGESVVEEEMRASGTKAFVRTLRTVGLLEEFGIGLDEDYVKHIEEKIWELRISRYRVLYFAFHDKQFVLLRALYEKDEENSSQRNQGGSKQIGRPRK